jgi:uncharacterized membrane protein
VTDASYLTWNAEQHAFIFADGRMKDIGVPSGMTSSYEYAINARGNVVGHAEN